MKKTILSLVAVSSLLLASDYSYEATIGGGKTYFSQGIGGNGIEKQTTGHVSFQYNDMVIKPQIAIESLRSSNYKNSTVSTRSNRVFLNGVYEFTDSGVVPYVLAGLGREDVKATHSSKYNDTALGNLGLGIKVPLFSSVSAKLEGRYMKRFGSGNGIEKVVLLALNIGFGSKAPVSTDDDNDGVLNANDKCPNTPAGTVVDANGCKKIGDSDNDGVLDNKDKCPNTPAGTKVDSVGCAVVAVVDSDNDGVADSADKCLNSPANAKVDSFGCIEKIKINDIRFASGSARINKKYDTDLNKLVTYLNANANTSAEIGGYTDSRGSAKFNKKLSTRRANAVKAYIVSKGINASRVRAIGHGEENPVATNKTAQGRKLNRRIEADIYLNK